MKKITITNVLSERIKVRHSGTRDIEVEGMDNDEDSQNYMEASDGYHTFTELYNHRIRLFIALAKMAQRNEVLHQRDRNVWCSTTHSDGTTYEGWFILGIGKKPKEQITYHLPAKFWNEVCEFAEVLKEAPEYDGHSSNDVLERLKSHPCL